MKKIIGGLLAALLTIETVVAAVRTYGAFGTATDTNTQLTVPFNPREICITNYGATNPLYADISGDGVAATSSGSTNIELRPGARKCFTDASLNLSPQGTFLIGLICTAVATTTYEVEATY